MMQTLSKANQNQHQRPSNLPLAWTKHLSTEYQRKSFEDLLRNSTLQFSRLLEILDEKERALTKQTTTLSEYENPSWSHKQAHINGYIACLTNLKELFTFLKG